MYINYLPVLIAITSTPDIYISPEDGSGDYNSDALEIAREFAACSGKYSALVEYSIEKKKPKLVIDMYKGVSGGARIASAYLFHSVSNEGKDIQDYYQYIDPLALSHRDQLSLRLADQSTPFKEILSVEMARCTELNPLQTQIINKLQEGNYTGGTNEPPGMNQRNKSD